jgi:hypothetical protein
MTTRKRTTPLTEAEWLSCPDAGKMIDHMPTKVSERKRRLFECACCRRVLTLLSDAERQGLGLAEQYAEKGVSKEEQDAGWDAVIPAQGSSPAPWTLRAVLCAKLGAWGGASGAAVGAAYKAWNVATATERQFQAELLRDILGNPFRPIGINSSWGTSNVVALAQTIYDERAFNRLPELAQALEEARCVDAELLGHLRGPGPHVRGCHVLDAVLGKG